MKVVRAWLGIAGLVAISGCGSNDRLFPLRVDNEWSYSVRTGLAEYVQSIKVTRRIPVAGVQGYELSSSMGRTRLAWKQDRLYATALTGTRFHPPLPLLSAIDERTTFKWRGRMYSGGKTYEADATLEQSNEPLHREGRKIAATKTVLVVRTADREVETQSWFIAGSGLVNQVQRTRLIGQDGGRFDLEMDYLSGP